MNRNASSMICPTAIIKGNVTLGSGCILHPQASIIAEGGAIEIGDNNIIEEYAVIYFRPSPEPNAPKVMRIGSNNIFEVRSRIEATTVGNANVIEIGAQLQSLSTVGNGCIIGIRSIVPSQTNVPDGTIMFGNGPRRRNGVGTEEHHKALQERHLDALRKILPQFHALVK
eukprot:TRINITY_DN4185_c0_g1_i2.p1 TRINITY_DN4185_c0_g1~~TRINITY_DN4185_c0_g1_i2.p1  ORF type:complete len:170 (-),score=25.72 TRINITY_DN4185_c0_g1_i2:13-522(-)